MKTIKIMKRLMGCAAAILALSACSESEDLLAAYHSDPNAVRITAQVGKASADGFTRSNPLGDADAQTKFNENDEISVQADGQDAVIYKLVGSEWQPKGNKFLKWENETMKFTAYYPATFNGTITQPTEYNKEADLAAADYMSYTGDVKNPGNNSLKLTMNRLMARVVVDVVGFNDQYDKNTPINSVSICGVTAYKHKDDGKFYALIKPAEAQSTSEFLSLEVGDNKVKETLTGIPTLEAGKSYTYELTVGKNKISVSGITVKDWTTSKTIIDGKAEQIIPYVTFKADGEQKFKMTTKKYTISGLEYSVNNSEWQDVVKDKEVTFGGTHGDLRLRGTNSKGTASAWNVYSTITYTDKTVDVACTGDIRTLLNWKYYDTVDTKNARFCYLFKDCAVLTSAPELPATELADYCYYKMFYGCTSLTSAPELKTTTLADYCYSYMFEGCTSLTSAPELKATELAGSCYDSMFKGCTSLTSAPKLKATELAGSCYSCMFYGCTSLTSAPELKATTLADYCYSYMFGDCTSLTSAPELKATELAGNCYDSMFFGCTKLSTVTMLASSDQISKASSYCEYWLDNAGTDVSSRTLIVTDEAAYNALKNKKNYLPSNWKIGAEGTTVVDKNNKIINIE